MAADDGQPARSLTQRLFDEPHAFEFTQAVRLLELLQPHAQPLGTGLDPAREALALSGNLAPAFPASALGPLRRGLPRSLAFVPEAGAERDARAGPPQLQVNAFSLGGPNGPLPGAWQEWLQDRVRRKDGSAAAFLDIFQHRLLALLYRAQRKYRSAEPLPATAERPADVVLRALTGNATRAAQQCLRETHFVVEIEHWLLALAETEGGDFACVLPHFGVDRAALTAEIRAAVARFKRGNTGMPSFAPELLVWLQDALVQSTVVLQQPRVRAATLLIALLENDLLRARAVHGAPLLLRVASAALRANFAIWLAPVEASAPLEPLEPLEPIAPGPSLADTADPDASVPALTGAMDAAASTPALLDQYTLDLTAEARAGRIDPIIGRNAEIRQTLDILLRRRPWRR